MIAAPQPRLPPFITSIVGRFLANTSVVDETVARFGSPVNVLFPEVFSENIARLEAVTAGRGLSSRVYYAHKANQAHSFAVAASRAGIGIDIASPAELDSAISSGFAVDRVEATGPKGDRHLRRLLETGVAINVDNLWELRRLVELTAEHPVDGLPVLLRLSGFDHGRVGTPPSRFGIDLADTDAALSLVVAAAGRIELQGMAFHLGNSDIDDRVGAIVACLKMMQRARSGGLRPWILDIGGGFRQRFTADPAAFARYSRALLDGLNGAGPALGIPGEHFGYQLRSGRYAGVASFHKFGNDVDGPTLLAALLDRSLPDAGGRTVAEVVRESLVHLWLEPGAALLDNAGITIAEVEFVKRLADGSIMVNLDISRDTVSPADLEVMVDPVIHYRRPAGEYETSSAGVFFGGRLCLERDMVTRRKVFPDRIPLPGDLVIFVNTAAYHMDFSATPALMHPLPPKVVAIERPECSGYFALEWDDSTRS